MSAVAEYKTAIDHARRRLARWPQLGIDAHDLAADAWLAANDADRFKHRHHRTTQSVKRNRMNSADAYATDPRHTDAPDMESLIDASRIAQIPGIEYASAPRGRDPAAVARANARRKETDRKKFCKAACPAVATARLDAFTYGLAETRITLAREFPPKRLAAANFRGTGTSRATFYRRQAAQRALEL